MSAHFWLRLARWLVAAYAIAQLMLSAAGIALFPRYAETHLDSDALTPNVAWTGVQVQAALKELGWPQTTVAWVSVSRDILGFLVVYPVLFLLLLRRPNSGFGIFVAFVFALSGPVGGVSLLPLHGRVPALSVVSNVAGAISWQVFFIMFYLFPDGRPVPGWTRWLVWAWGGFVVFQVATVGQVATVFGPDANPLLARVAGGVIVCSVLIAIGSQVYRYFWRSDLMQRQQTKWVVYVLALGAVVVGSGAPLSFRPPNPAHLGQDLIAATSLWYLFGLIFALVPATIGLAILRYRLWDIDVIIRRTLVYSVLTVLLALAYFGSVIVLQNFFVALMGQRESPLVTVLSTLVIAALFVPVRRRVQAFIDRRFYRRKYDAVQTLAAFGASARDEVDLDRLSEHLTEAVREAMAPESVNLWIRK